MVSEDPMRLTFRIRVLRWTAHVVCHSKDSQRLKNLVASLAH